MNKNQKKGSNANGLQQKTVNIFVKDVLSDSSDEEVSIKNKRELSSRHSYFVNYYSDSSEDDK